MSVTIQTQSESELRPDEIIWSQMPMMPKQRRSSRIGNALRQILIGVIVAAVFWLLGRHALAVVVVAASIIAAIVCVFSPRASDLLSRVVTRFQAVVGRALSWLLLGFVELIIFTPVAAIAAITRHDPLALGHGRNEPTQWRVHTAKGRKTLYARQFTYEWPAQVRRSLLGRLALAVGAVVLLMACDVGVGSAVAALKGTTPPTQTALFSPSIAAIPKTAWWPQVLAETFGIAATARPDPFLGWTFSDYSSPYSNISGGIRRSYEPPVSNGKTPVEVLFLGGSTVAGSYQRDDYTIPSDVARIASARGIPIHVTNRGAQGYSVWQELNLMEELLVKGYRPNVVVLYDGINELYVQASTGTTATPSTIKARQYETAILQSEQKAASTQQSQSLLARAYDAYANKSAIIGVTRDIFGSGSSAAPGEVDNIQWDSDQSQQTAIARGEDAAAIHNQAVSVFEALAAAYHFRLVSFWQPFLYSKTPIAGERNVAGLWGETPSAWRTMDAIAPQGSQAT